MVRVRRQRYSPAFKLEAVRLVQTADRPVTEIALVLDLFSRRVIGGATRGTLQSDLRAAALRMALARRRPQPGAIHHSDRGVQYASHTYQALLTAHRLRASMSRPGDCWDNAVAESFFSTLKQELPIRRWPTRAAAEHDVATYIEDFYNPVRLHSTLGDQAPAVFEAAGVM